MVAYISINHRIKQLTKVLANPKSPIVLSLFLFFSWLIFTIYASGSYQNLSNSDPLAMINVLFPGFWIVIIAFASLCFVVFRYYKDNIFLHILLVVQLSIILYYTPFLLGGFSWSPDSLWHGGVANYFPQIISGSRIASAFYCQSYPFSFLFSYVVMQFPGVNVFNYTLYIFPPVCIGIISALAYFFVARLFNPKTALLSVLMALPMLHYFEPHVSPFATGTVLVFTSLILLTYRNFTAFILNLSLVFLLLLTHPISPIFLGIYLLVAALVNLFSIRSSPVGSKINLYSLRYVLTILFLVPFWFFYTLNYAASTYSGVDSSVANVLNLGFLSKLAYASEWTMGGQEFVYPQISQLSLAIYGVFLLIVGFVFLHSFVRLLLNRRNLPSLVTKRLILSLAAIASAAMGYLLFLSSGERFLLGRGLLFFLIFGPACFVTYLYGKKRISRFRNVLAFGLILFLMCSFPIISYSKEAYNTFTPSANSGLCYVGSYVDFSQKSFSMAMDQQLASYVDLSKGMDIIEFPELVRLHLELGENAPDYIVLRINSYFVISMRYDGSFEDNGYTQLKETLLTNSSYIKTYSNLMFEVFVKVQDSVASE